VDPTVNFVKNSKSAWKRKFPNLKKERQAQTWQLQDDDFYPLASSRRHQLKVK
jgi:hypothetical protein